MSYTLEIPGAYGYVVLGCAVLPTFTNMVFLAGPVMKARKECDVQYPNLYATPGYHKRADEFNRVQRGHQNLIEHLTNYTAMSLLGGLKHPISVAVGGVVFCLGSVLYQKGYADMSLDVQTARFKKGSAIKWIGFFVSLYSSVSLSGSMIGWW